MALSRLLNSFRVRLLLLLALLLVVTVSVQYYVNLRAVRSNKQFIVQQQQAIMAGVALGVNSISSGGWLADMRREANSPLFGDRADRVQNVLIVDDKGDIKDSLENWIPQENPDKSLRYVNVKDISLPPLKSAVDLRESNTPLPQGLKLATPGSGLDQPAFYFPVETTSGTRYVIVILGSANNMAAALQQQSRRSLLWTVAVLLVMTALTAVVVWQFTRPVKSLSTAARRVAGGDLSFRVPSSGRRDEMGELTELFNDMTVQLGRTRELEAQLNSAEKAVVVSRLASAIAHEIRNPLNYINLTLDHLRTSFAPADPQKQEKFDSLTSQLKTEVARINQRITEFLNYSRPPKLEPRQMDLGDLAHDALRTVEVQASENNVELVVEEVGGKHSVIADAESLRSALTNLVINSLQSMDGEGGRISIVISREVDDRSVRIEVTDTGRGITAADISKIFEPYYSTKETGTGLGLAIVRKAIDDHGGSISVKSKEDEGTTFTIMLPSESRPVGIATGS
ncbi:MAG: ATP-binding protein [Pyrinomonadaceae bacterium]